MLAGPDVRPRTRFHAKNEVDPRFQADFRGTGAYWTSWPRGSTTSDPHPSRSGQKLWSVAFSGPGTRSKTFVGRRADRHPRTSQGLPRHFAGVGAHCVSKAGRWRSGQPEGRKARQSRRSRGSHVSRCGRCHGLNSPTDSRLRSIPRLPGGGNGVRRWYVGRGGAVISSGAWRIRQVREIPGRFPADALPRGW